MTRESLQFSISLGISNIIPPLLNSIINNTLFLDSRSLICLFLLGEAAGVMLNMILFVELLWLDLLSEDIPLEEIRKLSKPICCVVSCSAKVLEALF
jgi:hypothetical protein